MARHEGGFRGRAATVAVLAALAACPSPGWTTPLDAETEAVRPADARARELVQTAVASSPTVAALVETLRGSDVIVSVQVTLQRFGFAGDLRVLTAAGGCRYLMIRVSAEQSPSDQAAYLGHELQHANEVARAREVQDDTGLVRLMGRIGRKGFRGAFETDAAQRVTRQVQKELAGRGRRHDG